LASTIIMLTLGLLIGLAWNLLGNPRRNRSTGIKE